MLERLAPSRMQKYLLGLVSTLVSLAVAWLVVMRVEEVRAAPQSVLEIDTNDDIRDALSAVEGVGAAASIEVVESELPPLVHLRPLEGKVLESFYPALKMYDEKRGTRDDLVYVYNAPNWSRQKPWPEHPVGRWEISYNSLAIKHPTDVEVDFDGVRVLVTGDSHVEGVVPHEDMLMRVLEHDLGESLSDTSVEVLNVARGGWTLYNYLGALEKFAFLRPDVFVVVVYGGNDFSHLVRMERYFNGRGPFSGYKWQTPETKQAWKEASQIRSQEANQFWYYLANPGDESVSAQESAGVLAEIAERCELRGITPVIAYLPPPLAVQPKWFEDLADATARAFELGDDPEAFDRLVRTSDRIADEMIATLAESGVDCIDLRPVFRESDELLYWRTDCHINVAGHRVVAEALKPAIEAGLHRD